MSAHCRYHCRCCGGHFTSLEAFDAHREGPAGAPGACTFPDDAVLVELIGACQIGDPAMPEPTVTIYGCERARGARDYFATLESPQTAPVERKQAFSQNGHERRPAWLDSPTLPDDERAGLEYAQKLVELGVAAWEEATV